LEFFATRILTQPEFPIIASPPRYSCLGLDIP
jgi:hypothetical protein